MEIRDKALEPYFIKSDGTEWTVLKSQIVGDITKAGKATKNAGETNEIPEGYFTSLPGAIKKIINLKATDIDAVYTLREFIDMYSEITNQVVGLMPVKI